MRALIQRVACARVLVNSKTVGSIGRGMVLFLGIKNGDTEKDVQWLAEKCVHLRIFENDQGKFHFSLLEIGGELLVVSQFTLYGDCRRGRRPSFTEAALPEAAERLYRMFVDVCRKSGSKVETGIFAARMEVEIHNDGPVTLMVDSEEK